MSSDNKKNKYAAYEYLENGWNIFPVTPDAKTPLAKALKGGSQNSVLDARLNDDDVERIWSEHPNANIAAHTGPTSQIAVIDIDVAKTEAEVEQGKRTGEQATKLAKAFMSIFGETRLHRSPSGGYHLIYRYTPLCDGVGRRIDAFKKVPNKHEFQLTGDSSPIDLANIDILAGDGYILIPPSVIDGNEYTLLHELDGAELPDFPEELLRLLNRRDKVSKVYFNLKDGTASPIPDTNGKELKVTKLWDSNGKQKLIKKLQQYMGAGAGTRHDTLLKVCGTVFAHLPYKEWNTANQYIDMVIATFNPPYMKGTEVEIAADKREIRNAFEYAKANEYAERMHSNKKETENFEEKIQTDLAQLKEDGVDVAEDEYKEQVAKVFELFQTNDKGEPIPNDNNIAIILTHHPKYKNKVRYDTFKEQMTYYSTIGKKTDNHYLENKDFNPAIAKLVQEIQKDFFPRVSRLAVYSAAVLVGHDAEYDSYRDEMDSLRGKWDGEERMHLWLHKMFNVPDDIYHRGVAAQFIFAMVRRAYEPGAEFQKVLFLSSAQGTGKSGSMRLLAGDKGYLEFSDALVGREFALHAKGRKLIDLAEGESMRRSSVERIKAIISDQEGTHRTFGSGEVNDHPVRYVMSITNNNSPLLDNSGNRRYLVVDIPLAENEVGNFTWLTIYRSQLFAEAVHKYHEMKRMMEENNEIMEKAEAEADSKTMEVCLKRRRKLTEYEATLVSYDLEPENTENEVVMKRFRNPYGVALIPQEVLQQRQLDARMTTPIEHEIKAVLHSYDEYLAGTEDFFISTEEVVEQLDVDVIRQSRMGNFINVEVGKLLKIIDGRLESTRLREGRHSSRRGVRFKKPFINAKERLEAIKRLRKRAEALKPVPPSTFGGGSKAVTLEQKAARIRWEREGDVYLVFSEEDIQTEINVPSSVDVRELINQDDF